MEHLNKIEILGVVGQVRINPVGNTRVAHFSVVTEHAYKNREGENAIEITWHNCTAWEQAGQLDALSKGAAVHAFGRIRNQRYITASGEERCVTEILVSKLDIKA